MKKLDTILNYIIVIASTLAFIMASADAVLLYQKFTVLKP